MVPRLPKHVIEAERSAKQNANGIIHSRQSSSLELAASAPNVTQESLRKRSVLQNGGLLARAALPARLSNRVFACRFDCGDS